LSVNVRSCNQMNDGYLAINMNTYIKHVQQIQPIRRWHCAPIEIKYLLTYTLYVWSVCISEQLLCKRVIKRSTPILISVTDSSALIWSICHRIDSTAISGIGPDNYDHYSSDSMVRWLILGCPGVNIYARGFGAQQGVHNIQIKFANNIDFTFVRLLQASMLNASSHIHSLTDPDYTDVTQ